MRVYADAAALAAYPGGDTVPAGSVDVLLRAASRVVDTILVARKYDVDTDGLPTGVDDAQALSDAVCAIAVEAQATGALSAGSSQQWSSVSIGNVSLSGKVSGADAPVVLGMPVPPAAVNALSGVGVLWVDVR